MLRPGTHVLRRADGTLQVGLHPEQALVLPSDHEVRSGLALLSTCADASEYAGPEPLGLLTASDLVLDADALLPLIPAHADPQPGGPLVSRSSVAALARDAGDDAARLLAARHRTVVDVHGYGHPDSAALAEELTETLGAAGLAARTAPSGAAPVRESDVAALVGVGEPPRELVDTWMRSGTAHVLVRVVEGFATVGPFVVPGRTACLRCIDAHHTDVDRSWPLLVAQYASLSSQDRTDGVPEPVDPLLARIALAWAARDLVSHAEGRHPSTWSTTLRLDPHLACVENRVWLRHPTCGCSWA